MILFKLNVLLDRQQYILWAADPADLEASYAEACHMAGFCELLQVELDDAAVVSLLNGHEPPEDTVRETPLGGLMLSLAARQNDETEVPA